MRVNQVWRGSLGWTFRALPTTELQYVQSAGHDVQWHSAQLAVSPEEQADAPYERSFGFMSEALALQPLTISYRPWLGPVIDPPVTQHKGRHELPFVPLIHCGAFSSAN